MLLPEGFQFSDNEVSIRRVGEAVILEPVAKRVWPAGFFESIRMDSPTIERPVQPDAPPIRQV